MRELPKTALSFILLLAFCMLAYLAWELYHSDDTNLQGQYLDQIDIETGNPQPAGENTQN